jgi:outer membrane protein assembly factor BamA
MNIAKKSDGVCFLVNLMICVLQVGWSQTLFAQTGSPAKPRSISAFPILNYGSDAGLGFGGKGVTKNQLRHEESFDLILFGSSKGEQWCSFIFSVPDFEIRQGKRYPLALDLKLEYEKILKSNFFGFGNYSRDNEFQFPKEVVKMELTLGHAFTERIIGEFGYRFTHYNVYDFNPAWGTITSATPGAGKSMVSAVSARLRWDTRDSQINPHRGWRLFLAPELATRRLGSDWDFTKYRLETSAYLTVTGNHILAWRLWVQHVAGTAPYLELSKIGDSWTARGYKADRFMDKAMALASIEYRYPIYKKLGGVLFIDAGRVGARLGDFKVTDWHANEGLGLRYYLTNFVVRFDAGMSEEGTRIFFQFGQVF